MPSVMETIKFIGPARAEIAVLPTFAVYFAEPLPREGGPLAAWRGHMRTSPLAAAMQMEIDAGEPLLGLPRAGSIRCVFGDAAAANDLAALAAWCVDHLPLAWGTGGFAFHQRSGRKQVAYDRIAAAAKREWGVQLLDATALQWDALTGLPGANWLTLVGHEFAQAHGIETSSLLAKASALLADGVYSRVGHYGVVLAAGSAPTRGDVNVGDDLGAYARVAGLLEALLLRQPTPLSGAFASPEALNAWINRFTSPRAWMDCLIGVE